MPGTKGGGAEELPAIEMPSRVRIRQRLGQVAVESELAEKMERFGGQQLAPDTLIDRVETIMEDYAENKKFGIIQLVLNDMPLVLGALVDDAGPKSLVLNLWGERLRDRAVEDEKINEAKRRLTVTYPKEPRKIKKARKKAESRKKRGGSISIDPKRIRR
jgi:hypothetical protein